MDADDIEFCQSLMPKGACILDYTEYCATPQMIEWKLDCGYFKRDKYGAVVAIRDVAATDQLDLMNRIASEHNPPPEDSGWPKVWGDALAEVCMADRLSTVQWLLKHPTGRQAIAILRGARSLRADKTLSKLLSYPAELCNVEMMQYLYDQGAVDRLGNTLLDAIRANQVESVKWLLQHFPDSEKIPDYAVMHEAARPAVLLAASIPSTDAHGYMLIPESQFKGSANSAWIVQIDPVWASEDWDGNKPGSVDAFKALKTANNFKDLKTLMDDTSVYGADCGFTDPNGTPQPVPTDGKATFSRAIVHVGPCEIWLDNTKVLYEDDCFSKYGNENQDIKSVFPVDYSSCDNGGCKEMRFYWLAFQGLDGKTVWQSYKDCIPLEGSGGGTSQQSPSSSTGQSETPSSGDSPSSGKSDSPSSGNSDTPSSGESPTPAPESGDSPTQGSSAETPSAETPEVTPAPSSKCNGRKRRY
ncbi:hypothetical protein JG687_00004893 [Phytophthora cactorum]|uniref:Ankyrin repeat-containing domain n=1 Tax=Phytophthora cactorum TaxID=29920 RepID=A0A8T1UMI0_9STRA|nr:hypothetical protein JG687_00004893 [Phytophthora cactorum]